MNKQLSQIEHILRSFRHDSEIGPSSAFRTNARIRILNTIDQVKAPKILHRYPMPMVYAFRLALLLIFLFGGTVYAAQSSLPKGILYPVKTLSEKAALTLSPTESAKTSVAMTIISRRAEEHEYAEKTGDTQEIQQTKTNFESAVVEIRNTKRIDHDKVEIEIRKHESPKLEKDDVKGDATDVNNSGKQNEQREQQIRVTPGTTIKDESSESGQHQITPNPTAKESSVRENQPTETKEAPDTSD